VTVCLSLRCCAGTLATTQGICAASCRRSWWDLQPCARRSCSDDHALNARRAGLAIRWLSVGGDGVEQESTSLHRSDLFALLLQQRHRLPAYYYIQTDMATLTASRHGSQMLVHCFYEAASCPEFNVKLLIINSWKTS